mgnify:CR=1 FL=1
MREVKCARVILSRNNILKFSGGEMREVKTGNTQMRFSTDGDGKMYSKSVNN